MTEQVIAVSVRNISKIYRLWHTRRDRLVYPFKQFLSACLPLKRYQHTDLKSQHYRDFPALNDITLDVRKGESWGFIGVNGSGKSTLLKIISGNLRPTSGRVEVNGKVVILDYGSGFNGEFTGRDNIFIKAALLGLTRKQIKERYQSIIDFAEIGDFINQPVKTYSSGMVSRLGFAIMAHVDADIIITDEALAVGDVFFVQKCMKFIKDFLKRGTFLFVSHSTSDVTSLCQKAVWLEQGTIKAIGPADKVAQAYLAKRYLNYTTEDVLADVADDTQAALEVQEVVLGEPVQYKHHAQPSLVYDADVHQAVKVPMIDLNEQHDIGGAAITNIQLADANGVPLTQMIGGELVTLQVKAIAENQLISPACVFEVLDRLGQILFSGNSYLFMRDQQQCLAAGSIFTTIFTFNLPLLPRGDYVVRAAIIVTDEAGNAEILHTVNNALAFRCVTTGARHGLVGIPMNSISLKCKEVASSQMMAG